MPIPEEYSFPRYLSAKKGVDDRALNRHVWQTLSQALPPANPSRPLRVLEAGAGIGTMLERMLDWGLLTYAHYTAVERQPENLAFAAQRLRDWAWDRNFQVSEAPYGLLLERPGQSVALELEAIDVFDFIEREAGKSAWDLLVAHAFLDLVDVPSSLTGLFSLLSRGSLFYFSLNFDGATVLEPVIDPAFDELIQSLYHRTMDERVIGGRPSGDSRTGRRLFTHLQAAGAQILAAGASDWVVCPGPRGYTGDEDYFLHFILHFIESALTGRPELDAGRFASWLARRHEQVERGELFYLAHQLDFTGRVPGEL